MRLIKRTILIRGKCTGFAPSSCDYNVPETMGNWMEDGWRSNSLEDSTAVIAMRSPDSLMKRAAEPGGDMICLGEAMLQQPHGTIV